MATAAGSESSVESQAAATAEALEVVSTQSVKHWAKVRHSERIFFIVISGYYVDL
jgi:hypothetical protein